MAVFENPFAELVNQNGLGQVSVNEFLRRPNTTTARTSGDPTVASKPCWPDTPTASTADAVHRGCSLL